MDYIQKGPPQLIVTVKHARRKENNIDEMNNEYKDKLYIIGSLSQEEAIKSIADYYIGTERYRVRYVKKEPQKSLKSIIQKCFLNIVWADRVIAVPKSDGTYGEGVTYEIVFAKLIGKRVDEPTTVWLDCFGRGENKDD